MTPNELRQAYLNFFKDRGHAVIPSASLIPENDPTTLFTSSGMQPLVPYLLGENHPEGNRLVDSQKCFRAEDIDEVGDNRHTTFFEMLGNWSLGDYFKKEQLRWFFEFLTDTVKLDPERLYVTVFAGDDKNKISRDTQSVKIWRELFKEKNIEAKDVELLTEEMGGTLGMQGGRIFYYNSEKNWWSRSGIPENMPEGEPGGPDSEVFYEFTSIKHDPAFGKHCHPNCDCGRFLEIGNSVFMQYKKTKAGFERLPAQNVDFGGGLERILAAQKNNPDIFQTDIFSGLIERLESISGKSYQETNTQRSMRVIADHVRGAMFMIAEDLEPSNKQQGYILRRLIRRSVRHGRLLGIEETFLGKLTETLVEVYKESFIEIAKNNTRICEVIENEEKRFGKTLQKGLREFEKAPPAKTLKIAVQEDIKVKDVGPDAKVLSPELVFKLYETYGFPLEMSIEEAENTGIIVPENTHELFNREKDNHSAKSRTAAQGMFKGGLADQSEATTKLHTATHLLHAALRQQLGEHVRQEGSHITADRLRFDFTHDQALSEQQINLIEQEMNHQIAQNLPVTKTIEDKEEALKSGAMAFFREKYPDKVSVYTIGTPDQPYSRELCGGPHVMFTGEIGSIKIFKQQSIGAGKRRLYARLDN